MTTQNYEPSNIGSRELTLSEVVNKMYNQVKGVTTNEHIRTATLGTMAVACYLSKGFVKTSAKVLVAPYLLPTFVRRYLMEERGSMGDNVSEVIGSIFACDVGALGVVVIPMVGVHNFGSKYWYAFAVTNALSGVYEWYRHTKNKMSEQNIENQIIAEPNNKLEIAPPQEVNPEDEKARGLIVKSALKLEELAKELKQS